MSAKRELKIDKTENPKRSFINIGLIYQRLTDRQIDLWSSCAKDLKSKSISNRKYIKSGRQLFYYINMNLQIIGEPIKLEPPRFDYPQYITNIKISYINKKGKQDIRLLFDPEINKDTRIILSATRPLNKGKRYIDNSWFRQIAIIGDEFKSGCSVLAKYLMVYNYLEEDFYKISFKYREVNRISGISNMEKQIVMYKEPE